MSPVQAVPDFTPTEHIDAAVMELAAAAATHGKTKRKKPTFVAKKTSTISVYKSLSRSLWKLFNFSFSLGIPPCPFRPVSAGEKRVKSESTAGYYIVNERTGANPMYTCVQLPTLCHPYVIILHGVCCWRRLCGRFLLATPS
jgi:hypothetical protein